MKDVQVHFLLEEYRYDLDLEFRWLNRPPEEMINKWVLYEKLKKRSDELCISNNYLNISNDNNEFKLVL